MDSKNERKKTDKQQLPERFLYLHRLWLSLESLFSMASESISPDSDLSENRQEHKESILEYRKEINEAIKLTKTGIETFNCPIAKETERYVLSLHRIYENSFQEAEACAVGEQREIFCEAFYVIFGNRAKVLAERLILLSTQAREAAGLTLHTVEIAIDLSKFNETDSKVLLLDLINNPDGVHYDTKKYGDKQPYRLTDALKAKVKDTRPSTLKYADAAKAIGRKGNMICLKKGFRLISAKINPD